MSTNTQLQELVHQAREQFEASTTAADLENAKARYLGKSGAVTALMKDLARLPPEQKREQGAEINLAKQAVMKAGQYAYRDRRAKKREFRALWITRINAAVRELGMSYSVFMNGMKKASIDIDRKVLADMAVHDSAAFGKIVEAVRAKLA